jgi:hypothetical protein
MYTFFWAPLYRTSPKSILWRDIFMKEMKKFSSYNTKGLYKKKYRLRDYWSTSSLTRILIFGKLTSRNRWSKCGIPGTTVTMINYKLKQNLQITGHRKVSAVEY